MIWGYPYFLETPKDSQYGTSAAKNSHLLLSFSQLIKLLLHLSIAPVTWQIFFVWDPSNHNKLQRNWRRGWLQVVSSGKFLQFTGVLVCSQPSHLKRLKPWLLKFQAEIFPDIIRGAGSSLRKNPVTLKHLKNIQILICHSRKIWMPGSLEAKKNSRPSSNHSAFVSLQYSRHTSDLTSSQKKIEEKRMTGIPPIRFSRTFSNCQYTTSNKVQQKIGWLIGGYGWCYTVQGIITDWYSRSHQNSPHKPRMNFWIGKCAMKM